MLWLGFKGLYDSCKELTMTKAKAIIRFQKNVLPYLEHTDKVAKQTAWNDFVDSLCRGRHITVEQFTTWSNPYS